MQHILNLLAAVALLVWGAHTVRTNVLRVLGVPLRQYLSSSVSRPGWAFLSGVGVSGLLQSSSATCLIVSSFVGQGIFLTSTGLIMMLGADVGTSLMALMFSFDLSWLSPFLILLGVIIFVMSQNNIWSRWGRVVIGLGLMTLALTLIVQATRPITQSQGMHVLLSILPNDVASLILIGALLTVIFYSSLAMVLLTATLFFTHVVSLPMALAMVLGANLGSGLLVFFTLSKSTPDVRRVPLGNLIFKIVGCMLAIPFLSFYSDIAPAIQTFGLDPIVSFHVLFNVSLAALMFMFVGMLGEQLTRWLPKVKIENNKVHAKYLEPTSLSTPTFAIACAAREALHQADIVETMLRGITYVIQNDDAELSAKLRRMDNGVDDLYQSIKCYLTQISRETLSPDEDQRWADIMSFVINMEQVGDIVEYVLKDIEDKKIAKRRDFSPSDLEEIQDLHQRLISNMQLGMSIFMNGGVHNAQSLLERKAEFRSLEHEYTLRHLARLQANTVKSNKTSSLHIDLISDLKRMNSHICSIAYPILEQAGALAATRLKHSDLLPD